MTKFRIDGYRWVYLVVVIDWYTKKTVGHYSGFQAKADHWLKALNIAVNRQFPNGVCEQNLKLISNDGSQPTLTKFIKNCFFMKIKKLLLSMEIQREMQILKK